MCLDRLDLTVGNINGHFEKKNPVNKTGKSPPGSLRCGVCARVYLSGYLYWSRGVGLRVKLTGISIDLLHVDGGEKRKRKIDSESFPLFIPLPKKKERKKSCINI